MFGLIDIKPLQLPKATAIVNDKNLSIVSMKFEWKRKYFKTIVNITENLWRNVGLDKI